ncbi:MAG: heavy-metal-associated domain-containing protein [Acidobacteriota bacterium]
MKYRVVRIRRYLAVLLISGLLMIPAQSAAVAGVATGGNLGMLEVSVQVDGLSCPFCAYGLEKKLRKVENVAGLKIQVDEGRAVLRPEEGTSLDLASVEKAVRDGGFSPREITLRARGQITEFNGVPALELPNDTVLLLADNAETAALLESMHGTGSDGGGPMVLVEGRAVLESKDGHTGHPYTLTISSFEVD